MRVWLFCLIFMFALSVPAAKKNAEKKKPAQPAEQVKALSGISIVGNKEAPKSLYIVPWKNSEVGVETNLKSNLLNEDMVPVDKEVFMRELDFYDFSHRAR